MIALDCFLRVLNSLLHITHPYCYNRLGLLMEDGLERRRHLHRDVHVPHVRAVHGWGVAEGDAGAGSHEVTGPVVTPIGASQPSLTAIDSPENKRVIIIIILKNLRIILGLTKNFKKLASLLLSNNLVDGALSWSSRMIFNGSVETI